MTGALVVVPYDPEWPARFAAMRNSFNGAATSGGK